MSYQAWASRLRYPDDPAMQELYVQTFEFNPACTLEIGWHLFGENYERGEFLVRMREQLRAHGIQESTELPDHLTHLLPLLDRMEPESAAELACDYIIPALQKLKLEEQNPYYPVLAGIQRALVAEFGQSTRPTTLPIFQEAAYD